jgi:hypothetical protein
MKKFVSIYVTSTRDGGKPIEERQHLAVVREVAAVFSTKFGGATCTKGTGFWQSDVKGLIEEPITIVKSYHQLDPKDALAIVIPIAQAIKFRFNQEAVSVETEEGLEFI